MSLSVAVRSETFAPDEGGQAQVRFRLGSSKAARLLLALECEQDAGEPPAGFPDVALEADGRALPLEPRPAWSWVGPVGSGRVTRTLRPRAPLALPAERSVSVDATLQLPPGFSGQVRLRASQEGGAWVASRWSARDPDALRALRRLLPGAWQSAAEQVPQGPLAAVLEVMHGMLAPVDRTLRTVPELLDPARTPERFVPLLAAWLALDPREGSALPPNREWVAQAVPIAQSRGTRAGLLRTLQVATGAPGFRIEEGPEPFHMQVFAPAALRGLDGPLRDLIDRQRPAHMTYALRYHDPSQPS